MLLLVLLVLLLLVVVLVLVLLLLVMLLIMLVLLVLLESMDVQLGSLFVRLTGSWLVGGAGWWLGGWLGGWGGPVMTVLMFCSCVVVCAGGG